MLKFDYILSAKGQVRYHTIWIIVECADGIVDYYHWWYLRQYHVKLMKPKHGAHISIVRGEEEGIKPGLWKRNLDGPQVSFFYTPDMKWDDNYVWLDVWGSDLEKIRTAVGLSETPPFGFHLTVGRKS